MTTARQEERPQEVLFMGEAGLRRGSFFCCTPLEEGSLGKSRFQTKVPWQCNSWGRLKSKYASKHPQNRSGSHPRPSNFGGKFLFPFSRTEAWVNCFLSVFQGEMFHLNISFFRKEVGLRDVLPRGKVWCGESAMESLLNERSWEQFLQVILFPG